MANTTANSANVAQVWDSKFFEEYVRAMQFRDYMGTSENSVIQIKEQLTKKRGDRVNVALVKALSGSGVSGSTTLKGNEEALINYGHAINVDVIRNAVKVNEFEEKKSEIELRDAARTMLKFWAMDTLRADLIQALQSPVVDGVTSYAASTDGQRNTWLLANEYRVLFGIATSNHTGDYSADIVKVTASTDSMSPIVLSLAKRHATTPAALNTAGPIRPIRVDDGGEWFVCFMNPLAFRDLKAHATITQANREAMNRGRSNPLFRDGDLMWDGIIVREIKEIPSLGAIGDTSAEVGTSFLCGAQSAGIAWAQRTTSRTEVDDYGFEHGVAVQEIRGVEKLMFNSIQNGVFTIFTGDALD